GAGLRGDAQLGEPPRHCRAAGHGLQAGAVAAAAAGLLVAADADVADVAGRALGSPVELAVGHDAAADAGADLDEQQVAGVGEDVAVLAERHDVDVVVDEDVDAGKVVGDRVVVPAGHARAVVGPAGGHRDASRHAQAGPAPRRPRP